MEVETKHGRIIATKAGDPDYPGIWLEYVDDKDNGQNLSRPQVLMEQEAGTGNIRLLIWEDPNKEDYTREIILVKEK